MVQVFNRLLADILSSLTVAINIRQGGESLIPGCHPSTGVVIERFLQPGVSYRLANALTKPFSHRNATSRPANICAI